MNDYFSIFFQPGIHTGFCLTTQGAQSWFSRRFLIIIKSVKTIPAQSKLSNMDISRLNGAPEPPIQLPPTYSKPTGRRTMKRDLTDADVNQQMMLLDHLPPCTGPKLHAFRYRNENIQWIVRLDDPRKPQGLDQGHVFEVVIQNQRYALKLVS